MPKTRPPFAPFAQRSSLFRVLLLPLFTLLFGVSATTIFSLYAAFQLALGAEVRRESVEASDTVTSWWLHHQLHGDDHAFVESSLPSDWEMWALFDVRSGTFVMSSHPALVGRPYAMAHQLFPGWSLGDDLPAGSIEGDQGNYVLSRPISGGNNLHMVVLFRGTELHQYFDMAMRRAILMTAGALTMLGLLGYLLLRLRVIRPLRQIHEAIHRFNGGNLHATVVIPTHDEVGRIAHGLNALFAHQVATLNEARHLAQVAQVTGNLVCMLDLEGRITWANRAVEKLLNRPLADFLQLTVPVLLPAIKSSSWPRLAELTYTGKGQATEVVVQPPGHDALTLRVDSQPVLSEDGVARGFVLVATNVTSLRQVQARLEQSEFRYQELVNSTDEIFFQIDRDDRFIFLNQAWETITGYRVVEAMGERLIDFFHAADRGEFALRRQRLEHFEAGRSLFELRLIRRDGHERVLEVQLRGQRSPTGQLQSISGKMRDVTVEREATEQLRRSRQRLARVLEGSNDGFWDYNVETGEVLMSPGYYRLLGYSVAELDATTDGWRELIHPEDLDEAMRRYTRVHAKGEDFSHEYRMRTKSGKYIWVLDRGRVVEERDGRAVMMAGSITNINERVEVEQRTRLALEREQQLNEMKSRIVSMISHEYRTPLSSIRLSATLLQRYAGKLSDDERGKHLGYIFEAVDQLTTLIEEVLYLGRAEAGYVDYNPDPRSVRDAGQAIVDWFHYLYPRRELQYTLQGDADRLVMIDLNLFKRMATNLLTNAVKYSAPETPVEFRLAEQGDHLKLVVRDQGIGIPPEDQKNLFETFHRASNVGTIPGTGLGLVITRRVVEKLGGQIGFQSQVGQGTTFTIRLPALEPGTTPPTKTLSRPAHEQDPAGGR